MCISLEFSGGERAKSGSVRKHPVGTTGADCRQICEGKSGTGCGRDVI